MKCRFCGREYDKVHTCRIKLEYEEYEVRVTASVPWLDIIMLIVSVITMVLAVLWWSGVRFY